VLVLVPVPVPVPVAVVPPLPVRLAVGQIVALMVRSLSFMAVKFLLTDQ
jgi:hypothetical protein